MVEYYPSLTLYRVENMSAFVCTGKKYQIVTLGFIARVDLIKPNVQVKESK